MSSQNHTTNTNTASTSTRKLEKLNPPSKSIAASSFTILVPIACDQFIRPQRRRILHFGGCALSKGAMPTKPAWPRSGGIASAQRQRIWSLVPFLRASFSQASTPNQHRRTEDDHQRQEGKSCRRPLSEDDVGALKRL